MHDEEPLYQGYFHVAADMQARARRQRLGKLSRHPALAVHVIDCLKAAWSPEQIAGRLRISGAPRSSHFGSIPQRSIEMTPPRKVQVLPHFARCL